MARFRFIPRKAWLLAACLGLSVPWAAGQSITESHPGEMVFSLLPRPFQKDPRIDIAVITEVTPEGRKHPSPTAARPAYYEPVATGYHDEGQGFSSQRTLAVATLQKDLEAAMTRSHFLVADRAHPPTLVVFFVWGSANGLDPSHSSDGLLDDTGAEDLGHQNLLARARLVGGTKFAHDYQAVLNEEDLRKATGMKGPGPLERFLDRDSGTTRQLVEQSKADCFYVVASAYEKESIVHPPRKLLWRSSMTADSLGVSIEQTLPTLIVAGGPYFGRDMSGPATLAGHLVPAGKVEIGTPVQIPAPAAGQPGRR
jgi:hypothetical protein